MSKSDRTQHESIVKSASGGWEEKHATETDRWVHSQTETVVEVHPTMPSSRPPNLDSRAQIETHYRVVVRDSKERRGAQLGSDFQERENATEAVRNLLESHPNGHLTISDLNEVSA